MFLFPFPRAPRERGNRNRESARDGVAGAVLAEPAVGDERDERGLEGRVPDLAALAERRRRERRVGELELGKDALADGSLCGRVGHERDGRAIDRRERDSVVGGVEVE